MPNERANNLFRQFLNEEDSDKSAFLLGELLYIEVFPLITKILVRNLQNDKYDYEYAKNEAEDLSSEIIVSFISRIEKIKLGKFQTSIFFSFEGLSEEQLFIVFCIFLNNQLNLQEIAEIRHIDAYFIGASKLKLQNYWREKNPIWFSLSNKIRYILDNQPDFQYDRSEQTCFLKENSNTRSELSVEDLVEIFEKDSSITQQTELFDFLKVILEKAKGGLKLKELVTIVFKIQYNELEINETSIEADDQLIVQGLIDKDDHESYQESLLKLKETWIEIKELIFHHRFVFILTTKKKNNISVIYGFYELGLTTKEELAEILTVTNEEFNTVWDKLPLPDKEVACLLSKKLKESNLDSVSFEVTVTQVRNFRQKAKEKLKRGFKV
ncbi:MAG: hypothetical protein MUF43_09150 [Flavobacterium sp.]|nr:hypothetical protein [Flavobacterium sp.]